MSIFTSIEGDFERFWENHAKPFLDTELEPTLKSFFQLFDSQFGKQALTAAIGAVATIETGGGFAAVATGLATTLYQDAVGDAKTDAGLTAENILATVQSALQVAKATSNTITTSDKAAVAIMIAPIAN